MSKPQVKDMLDRVLTWSSDRQDDAAEILALMEAQDQAGYHLTDEQVREIERRRRDGIASHLTLDDFNARIDRLLGE
ncbi:hypothetical protein ACQR16_33115 [Bradyrhizobium oligotrophicum]|uniref:hypothetical protein n=1 Tax=Bradyrhizobium oligotrophicum TaxID=44255 RepID=UPI003EC0FBDD